MSKDTPKEVKKGTDGRPSKEQIAEWKGQHKELHEIEMDGKVAIVRKPTMFDLERAMVMSKKQGAKPLDFNRNIVGNCLLFVDEGARSNDEFELWLLTSVGQFADIKEGTVKKL